VTPDYTGYGLDPLPVPWADLKDPQSLNLYGYVRSNPASFDDLDGHDCVTQTRTGDTTETVSVSSGNCDNVKVGDGQSKTYVPGTTDVSRIRAGADGHSIDIGYTPYEGGGTGTFNAAAAPDPDNRNLAYGFNQDAYRTLTQASMTANRIAAATGVVSGVAGCIAYCSAAGASILSTRALAQTATNAAVLRIAAFLESKGIPATVAMIWGTKMMLYGGGGTQPKFGDKWTFTVEKAQQLNQMLREYIEWQVVRQNFPEVR
jgi:hypothetical protein